MILSRIENSKLTVDEAADVRFNLNKLYLQLVNLYMVVNKSDEAQAVINNMDQRLDNYVRTTSI